MLEKRMLKISFHLSIIKRLLIILLIFTLARVIFYLFNLSYFSGIGIHEFLVILFYGIRFDISAILMLNAIYILLLTIPFKFRYIKGYRKLTNWIFYITNSIGFAANCVDFMYFRFTLKRTTFDIFHLIGYGDDMQILLPQFIKDFWYVPLIWFSLIFVMVFLSKRVKFKKSQATKNIQYYLGQSLYSLIFIFISFIGIRGGFQLRPLNIINAAEYTKAQNIPLVLNTPFTIIKTVNKQALESVNYFKSEDELNNVFSPIHEIINDSSVKFNNLNVVIIIMESFSKEHIGSLNEGLEKGTYQGFTPFLDSLITVSKVYPNAFANGKKSIEAIPAIVAGFPTLMDNPFISSIYSGNKIQSLAALLKEKGYSTSFYHGGTNGTMGFESFALMSGFDKYIGRHEYNNEKHYDGKWGIYDKEFFQFYANELNGNKEPFMSAFFSLSSHHPYIVPEKYLNKLPKGKLQIQQSIAYADYSLSKFFETAAKMSWFDNTLFVITADHTSDTYYPYYQNRLGMYSVPLLYYRPNSNFSGIENKITQQIDIMPSILDYLNYDKDFFAFGESSFDSLSSNFSISYLNNSYQLVMDDYLIQYTGNDIREVYNIRNDSLLENNIANINNEKQKELSEFLKAIIQQYNNRMNKNKLTIN
ncbi:LTA synthase family protein [Bacteroidota bacterium]